MANFKPDANGKLHFTSDDVPYRLSFQRIYCSLQIERIRIYGKNSEMIVQSDRPDIHINNRRKEVNWKIISEQKPALFEHPAFIIDMLVQLEFVLNKLDFPKAPYINPKNLPDNNGPK